MKIVIWNDQSCRGEEIKRGLMQNGLADYSHVVIVANNYEDFAQKVKIDFSVKEARESFFSDNFLITDMALAEGNSATEQTQPFRDLIKFVYPWHLDRIFVYSSLTSSSACIDYVGKVYFNDLKSNMFAGNVQKLAGHVQKKLAAII